MKYTLERITKSALLPTSWRLLPSLSSSSNYPLSVHLPFSLSLSLFIFSPKLVSLKVHTLKDFLETPYSSFSLFLFLFFPRNAKTAFKTYQRDKTASLDLFPIDLKSFFFPTPPDFPLFIIEFNITGIYNSNQPFQ